MANYTVKAIMKNFEEMLIEIADSDKPNHIISVAVGASCLLRHALIGCLHADNAILIAGIVKNRPIISPDIAHNKSLLSGFPDIVLSAFLPSFPKSSRFVQRPFHIEPATLRYRYIILIDIGVLCLQPCKSCFVDARL